LLPEDADLLGVHAALPPELIVHTNTPHLDFSIPRKSQIRP
jgi:hypothetical protein